MTDPGSPARSPLARMRSWAVSVRPRRADLRSDIVAGLPGAVSSVPDGMASATLVGVNPAYGLYAAVAGPVAGGLTSSTRMMVVTTTTAASLAAGSALASVPPDERDHALVMLSLVAGLAMVAAGMLRLGRYVRFVSRSVMLGFLSGVSVNIVLGQLVDLLGSSTEQSINLLKALDVLLHPGRVDLPTALTGVAALVLLVALERTRLSLVASLVAVALPTAAVVLLHADSVSRVSDSGPIPAGLPPLVLPHLSDLSPTLVLGALSVAAIVLVQGSGVAEAAPNRSGPPSRANRDFIGQGAGNIASSLVHGIPVGGSVSATALNITAGARSRWAAIWSGLWMLVILVALSRLVAEVATPTLAAVLIVVGVSSLRPREALVVWRTGTTAKVAMTATFVATLLLPVAAAVGAGLVISLLLQLNRGALDLTLVRLTRDEQGRVVEGAVPTRLADHEVVVLGIYGSLLYAGARTLQAQLPDPAGAVAPVVVLRLRGHSTLGATFFAVGAGYAERLEAVGGRLYLSGVDPRMVERYRRAHASDTSGTVRVVEATEVVGEATLAALEEARAWVVRSGPAPDHSVREDD